ANSTSSAIPAAIKYRRLPGLSELLSALWPTSLPGKVLAEPPALFAGGTATSLAPATADRGSAAAGDGFPADRGAAAAGDGFTADRGSAAACDCFTPARAGASGALLAADRASAAAVWLARGPSTTPFPLSREATRPFLTSMFKSSFTAT